jgi:hypothetical protein
MDAIPDFDQVVMLAVMHLSPDAYGIAIRREIEARTGRSVPLSTIYATLVRLEARGYVRSQLGSPSPEPLSEEGDANGCTRCSRWARRLWVSSIGDSE